MNQPSQLNSQPTAQQPELQKMFVAPEMTDVQQGLSEARNAGSSEVLTELLQKSEIKLDDATKRAEAFYAATEKTENNTALYQSFLKQMEAYRFALDTLKKTGPGKFATIDEKIKTSVPQLFEQFAPSGLKNLFVQKESSETNNKQNNA